MAEGRKCPRCGRGFGWGNCAHHPPCDRKIADSKNGVPSERQLERMIREAYARHEAAKQMEEFIGP